MLIPAKTSGESTLDSFDGGDVFEKPRGPNWAAVLEEGAYKSVEGFD